MRGYPFPSLPAETSCPQWLHVSQPTMSPTDVFPRGNTAGSYSKARRARSPTTTRLNGNPRDIVVHAKVKGQPGSGWERRLVLVLTFTVEGKQVKPKRQRGPHHAVSARRGQQLFVGMILASSPPHVLASSPASPGAAAVNVNSSYGSSSARYRCAVGTFTYTTLLALFTFSLLGSSSFTC